MINKSLPQHESTIIIGNLIFYKEFLEKDKDIIQLFNIIDDLLHKNNELIHNARVSELWNLLFKQNKPSFTAFNKNVSKMIANTTATTLVNNKKGISNDKDSKDSKENILITFTTCKRLDLFKETINSILNQWLDVDLITNWFCVDDNSSKEDRQFMKSTYHWLDYYMKTPSEKGHRTSMNIIWNKLHDLKRNASDRSI